MEVHDSKSGGKALVSEDLPNSSPTDEADQGYGCMGYLRYRWKTSNIQRYIDNVRIVC